MTAGTSREHLIYTGSERPGRVGFRLGRGESGRSGRAVQPGRKLETDLLEPRPDLPR